MKEEKNGAEITNELVDSIEWGTASKGSKKKVYGDALNGVEDFKKKINNMKELEKLALEGM